VIIAASKRPNHSNRTCVAGQTRVRENHSELQGVDQVRDISWEDKKGRTMGEQSNIVFHLDTLRGGGGARKAI